MKPSITESFQEYARGVAGGLMFSLPLIYTMEMWWAGFVAHPARLALFVAATFILLIGYNHYAGLRHDATFAEEAIDSVEEMGIGLVVSAVFLWLLGRWTFEMTMSEIVGKIVIEAMVVAIGVSVGTAQLGGASSDAEGQDDSNSESQDSSNGGSSSGANNGRREANDSNRRVTTFGGRVVLAICGAVLFAANVAPTEEIEILGAEIPAARLIALALASLVFCALTLYYIDFHGAHQFVSARGFSNVMSGVVMTYTVALAVSAAILWFFGRFDGLPLAVALGQIIVLGVAATLGASAGRLLVQ